MLYTDFLLPFGFNYWTLRLTLLEVASAILYFAAPQSPDEEGGGNPGKTGDL